MLEALPGVFLNLDIKQTAPVVAPYEARLADLLREFGRADDVIVASFLDGATDVFKAARARDQHVGRHGGGRRVLPRRPRRAAGARERHPAPRVAGAAAFGDITLVDDAFVDRAHAAGLAVHVWTIDDADEMRRLLALDVDGIMTDRPSVLSRSLAATG